MVNRIIPDGVFNSKQSSKSIKADRYNTRVARWQLPYDKRYSMYDKDNSKWFEAINKNYDNEIENVEKNLNISLSRYKVYTRTIEYSDKTVDEVSKYPNGNVVTVKKGKNCVLVSITDSNNRLTVEKIYSYDSDKGKKILYKYIQQGDNIFTIVRVFSYDTTKNKKSDIINYGYTSMDSTLLNNAILEKEYYLLNNKEVQVKKKGQSEYIVKDKQGKNLFFESNDQMLY